LDVVVDFVFAGRGRPEFMGSELLESAAAAYAGEGVVMEIREMFVGVKRCVRMGFRVNRVSVCKRMGLEVFLLTLLRVIWSRV
jgi:hypothetical protein